MFKKKNKPMELRECKVCFTIKEMEKFSDRVYPKKEGMVTFSTNHKTFVCRQCEYDLLHDERIKLHAKYSPKKI